MATRFPTNGTGALKAHPLTLLRGGKTDWRDDEADIEALAYIDETCVAMDRILTAELARDVPSMFVINEAGRVAHRGMRARDEIVRLRRGPEDAA